MQLDVAEYKIAMLSNCLVKNEAHLLNEGFITPPPYRKTKKKKNSLASGKSFFIFSKGKFVVCIGFNYIQLDLPTLAVR